MAAKTVFDISYRYHHDIYNKILSQSASTGRNLVRCVDIMKFFIGVGSDSEKKSQEVGNWSTRCK